MSALFVLFIVDVIREIKESSNAMTEIIDDFYEKELWMIKLIQNERVKEGIYRNWRSAWLCF